MKKKVSNKNLTLIALGILNSPVSRTELAYAWQELAYQLRGVGYSWKTIYKSLMGVDELRKWGQIKADSDGYSLAKAGIEKLKYLDVVYGLPIKPEWLDKYYSPRLEGKDVVVGVCGNKYCKKVLKTKFKKAEDPNNPKRHVVKIT